MTATLRLCVVESDATGRYAPRVIGTSDQPEPLEQGGELIELARAEFARLGRAPGPLSVYPAEPELVAAFEKAAQNGKSYYSFHIDADGIARKSKPGRIHVVPMSRREMKRGEVSWS